jgi:NADH:ubiquinone oxidoreductase subunit E
MKKIHITVCLGTTCHLMGTAHLQTLSADLPKALSAYVEVEYKRCLGLCDDTDPGKSPYVIIDNEIINEATMHRIIEKITFILDQRNQQ